MSDMDDSHPPLDVIVSWIPAIVTGRYIGLSAWIMFIWDHGEPTSRIFNRMALLTLLTLHLSDFI